MANVRNQVAPAYLVLEDGTVYSGYSMGKQGKAVGEVVFNTNCSTYQDLLNDPTYSGQIVIQTYPLIGNRGVDPNSSSRLVASGYVVREWCVEPTDAHEYITLDEFLKQDGVTGLCGIDTRSLTRRIRQKGVMNGAIVESLDGMEELLQELKAYRVPPAIGKVTVQEPMRLEAKYKRFELAVPDYGMRRDILEFLLARGCSVTLYPAHTPAEELLKGNPDGVMLSDGPGDPWDNPEIIAIIQELVKSGKPIFGVGLGHQLLAVANGFAIEKLPVGHRGANQPVRRLDTRRVLITAQNHGYTVKRDSVDPAVAEITHENVNDNTVEGLKYLKFPALTLQFEPGDGPGYQDTAYLFDQFVTMLKGGNANA
jgi:carbamoyl-phosphate synthase small subunit